MKKSAALVLALILIVGLAGLGYADHVYTNALGQTVTVTISEGASATVSAGTAVAVPTTERYGIRILVDTNAAPDVTAFAYTNKATIGDMLIGTVSNKLWVLTSVNTFTEIK